jgi:hypothetical protein
MLREICPYCLEISPMLFTESTNSIQDFGQGKSTIEELRVTRNEKLWKSISEPTSEALDFFDLPNATRMELHIYQEPSTQIYHILTALHAIRSLPEDADGG